MVGGEKFDLFPGLFPQAFRGLKLWKSRLVRRMFTSREMASAPTRSVGLRQENVQTATKTQVTKFMCSKTAPLDSIDVRVDVAA